MARNQRAGRTALIEPLSVFLVGLNATPVGSTDDSVLRWLVAGTFVTGPGDYIAAPDSATLGTIVTINTPGIYRAEMMLAQVESTSLLMGIAKGTTTGTFAANPVINANGVIATSGPHTLAASTAAGRYLAADFTIGDSDLDGTNNLVRFLATNNAGATPEPALTEAACWARITRIADQAA